MDEHVEGMISSIDDTLSCIDSTLDHIEDISLIGTLTTRERFAMVAMHGICASGIVGMHNTPKNLSRDAVQYADSLIAELAKVKS